MSDSNVWSTESILTAMAPNGWKGAQRTGTAENILNHHFEFYGESHQLADPVDWEFNPGTAHWTHDLNRFFFLEPLLDAFERTGDARYATKGVELILSWIAQSKTVPTDKGNYFWASYLNVAIHLETWGTFLAGLRQRAPHLLGEEDFATIRESVQFQISFLDNVIPTRTNNWVIIGSRGILAAAVLFPFIAEREALCERAWSRTAEALSHQLLPDGVQDELTPHYHFTVLVCVLQALAFEPFVPVAAPERVSLLARSMIHYLRQTLTPDGYQVAFNDSDPACGEKVRNALDSPVARALEESETRSLKSEAFPWSGVVFMREGTSRGLDECYLAFDAGPFGVSHQHEDKLGFWLTAFGRSFLVDPGRHLYDFSEASLWPFLRTTAAHSTILIDGQGQNSRAAREVPNAWRTETPLPLLWEQNGDGSVAGAFYDLGYGPEQIAVKHLRLIFFFADLRAWAIVDRVEGEGEHRVESRFQFAPCALSTVHDPSCLRVQTCFDDVNLEVKARPEDWEEVRVICGERNPDGGWFSPGINAVEPAPCAAFSSGLRQLPWHGIVALVPFRGRAADPAVASECLRRASSRYPQLMERLCSMAEQ